MAMDLAAIKAKLAALKNNLPKESENVPEKAVDMVADSNNRELSNSVPAVQNNEVSTAVSLTSTDVIGTAKTSEIDHLDFLNKMNMLQEAIHKQHPTMPVLLMQIHKQLRADPELTSTLSEEGIGVIVKGLQIQTKTELVSVVMKESKSKKNKTALTTDMF